MPREQTQLRLTLLRYERSRWEREAKKFKLTVSQYARMIVNAKIGISTDDLVKKLEKQHPNQMSLL